jgi:uncharacterized protein DUF2735
MTTNLTTGLDRSSATIYQFPARGRYAAAARGIHAASMTDRVSPHVTRTVLGSAWYHDEAIRAERAEKDC